MLSLLITLSMDPRFREDDGFEAGGLIPHSKLP